eukprot:4890208-Prymnesium_polylepis.1
MMRIRDGLFVPLRPVPTEVSWPRAANFAVWRVDVRSRPLKLWEALLRLQSVEGFCHGWATISWAHALERLWLDLFDPTYKVARGRLLDVCWRSPRTRWDHSWKKNEEREAERNEAIRKEAARWKAKGFGSF